jgi:hypothetical protein
VQGQAVPMTRYWITTHWPKRKVDPQPWHIYLQEGFETLGRRVEVGNPVLFFELKTGKVAVTKLPDGREYQRRLVGGRQGIVASAVVSTPMMRRDPSDSRETYIGGKQLNWPWEIPTSNVNLDGFVPRADVNRVLGYDPEYTLMGFGDRMNGRPSGLKQLTEDQYRELTELFRASSPREVS